jgi:hypothetical protein
VTDLNARYGKKPANQRRNVIVLATSLLLAFLAWAIAVNFFTPTEHKDFSGETVRYATNNQNLTVAEVKLSGYGAIGTIHCTAKALDAGYVLVGFREFDTVFQGEAELRFNLEIRTTAKASSVVIEACSLK